MGEGDVYTNYEHLITWCSFLVFSSAIADQPADSSVWEGAVPEVLCPSLPLSQFWYYVSHEKGEAYWTVLKTEHPATCLVTVVYVYAPLHGISVTIFSTNSKFWLVSNFTELHALTQATCSYVLLVYILYMHAFSITQMAVPISWSPQFSWLSLVLPETYPT